MDSKGKGCRRRAQMTMPDDYYRAYLVYLLLFGVGNGC